MAQKHRLKITAAALTLIFALAMRALISAPAAAAPAQILFVNDRRWPAHEVAPFIWQGGDVYILASAFFDMQGVSIGPENFTDRFFIEYSDRFVSFHSLHGTAFDMHQNLIPGVAAFNHWLDAWRRHIYVPARALVNELGLILETETIDGQEIVRIRNSSVLRLPFDHLIRNIIPPAPPTTPPPTTLPPPAPTTAPPPPQTAPTTTRRPGGPPPPPPTTPTTTNPENTRPISNYLTFFTNDRRPQERVDDNLDNILSLLAEHDIRAMFFMSAAQIRGHPDRLRRIFASGHDIGINIDRAFGGADQILSEAEAANALIYALIKQRARIYTVTADMSAALMREGERALYEAGYFLSRRSRHVDQYRFANIDMSVEFIREEQINLWAFDFTNAYYMYYLELMAEAADIKFYINFSHLNSANISDLGIN